MKFKLFILVVFSVLFCQDTHAQGLFNIRKKRDKKNVLKPEEVKQAAIPIDTATKKLFLLKDVYNIAVLLPFYLDNMDDHLYDRKEFEYEKIEVGDENAMKIEEEEDLVKIYPKSKMALSFYEGILLALDTLQKLGLSCNIKVYDTKNDTNALRKIRGSLINDSLDLIIGPVYNKNMTIMAKYAFNYKVPIISPLSSKPVALRGNPYFIMANPTIHTQCKTLVSYMYENYKNKKVLIVKEDRPREGRAAKIFERCLNDKDKNYMSEQNDEDPKSWLTQIRLSDGDYWSLKKNLQDTSLNVVAIASSNEAFVSKVLKYLVRKADSNAVVFGLPNWSKFETIETETFQRLNTHIPSTSFIDLESNNAKWLRSKYRRWYKSEPDKHVIRGFDIGYYYLGLLLKYGNSIIDELIEEDQKSIHTSYDHHTLGIKYGLENKYVSILKFQNFQLVKVGE